MAKRTASEISRTIAMQNDTVRPPKTREWAEIEKERLAAIGKAHLGPLSIFDKLAAECDAKDAQQRANRKRRKRNKKKGKKPNVS